MMDTYAPAGQVLGTPPAPAPLPPVPAPSSTPASDFTTRFNDTSLPMWQRLGYESEAKYNIYLAMGLVGGGLGAYHGYRRNERIGWAIWWLVCGAVVPIPTVAIALAQGFGQKKK